MKVTVREDTAFDEECRCGKCQHHFLASAGFTKLTRAGELVDGLLICCPKCFSDDVHPTIPKLEAVQ